MALTPTTSIPLGFKAPDFALTDVCTGKTIAFDDVKGTKGTVVMFICNHCPYVVHIVSELVQVANDFLPQGIGFVAISSNDAVQYPQDGPELMRAFAAEHQFPFPYCYDESQEVAKAYDAACTPDFSVTDGDGNVVYRGEFDSARPSLPIPVTGDSLRQVLNGLIEGISPAPEGQRPSMGCNIKWKL